MSLPGVNQTIREGGLGVQPNVANLVPCIIGVATSGPFTPVRVAGGDLAAFDGMRGPLARQGSRIVGNGRDVVILRAAETTAGAASAVTTTAAGSSVITTTGAPNDSYEVVWQAEVNGTIGSAGIVFRWSIDGGRSFSPPTALGTATTFLVPGTNLTFAFAAGTILATTKAEVTTTAPKWDLDDIQDALTALKASSEGFDWIQILGSMSATEAAGAKATLDLWSTEGTYRRALCESAVRTGEDTLAQWRTAILTDYAAFESRRIAVGAGECLFFSRLDNKTMRQPMSRALGLRLALVDPARYNAHRVKEDGFGGPLDCSLFDSAGNAVSHNEATNPSLDTTGVQGTARFATLRTLPTKGRRTFCTRANLMSPPGSEFQTFRHGIVMDLACTTTHRVLTDEIGETPLLEKAGPRAGKISETYAASIEQACRTALRNALLTPGRASDAYVVVERNDNVLSTKKVRVKTYVLPLGDVDYLENEVSYINPALGGE